MSPGFVRLARREKFLEVPLLELALETAERIFSKSAMIARE
jgi:hypothetical protein